MAGKHRAEPDLRPDALSLDTWAAWAGLGAPVDQYPPRRSAHRAPSRWRAVWDRLATVPRRAAGR